MERMVISSLYIPNPLQDHQSAMKKMPMPSLGHGYNISRNTEGGLLILPNTNLSLVDSLYSKQNIT